VKIVAVVPIRMVANGAGYLAWWALYNLALDCFLDGFYENVTGRILTL
jgi:hypothetical protein